MTKRNFSPKHKAVIGLAALKGDKTMAQISSDYQVHPTQINRWKTIVEQGLPGLFSNKSYQQEMEQKQELIDELYRLIGQRDIELSWLKKKLHLIDL